MKNNKFIKFLSTILVAILMLTIAPVNDAVANEMKNSTKSIIKTIGEVVEAIEFTLPEINLKAEAATYDIEWNYDGETLVVSGSGIIPDDYYTNGEWTELRDECINIQIEGDITGTEGNVFRSFTALEKVEILCPLEKIGERTFSDCTSLKEINLPDSLISIYDKAFLNCTSLENIKLPENLVRICESAFENCNCFDGEELVLPDSLKYVGLKAFYGTDIKKLTAPFVGEGPYDWEGSGTYNISSMFGIVPASLKEVVITKYLFSENFQYASNIEKIVIKDTVEATQYPISFAEDCYNLKELVLENRQEDITYIGAYSFKNCTSLESFTIPENVTIIGSRAFYGCKFEEMIIPSKVEKLGDYAFYNCIFDDIIIPEAVKEIGDYAFAKCKNIESIIIPDSVTTIGDYAFKGCSKLKNVELPNNISSAGAGIFDDTIYISELNEDFLITENGVLIDYIGDSLDVVVPEGVLRIGAAFTDRKDITSITLPQGLLYISKKCFENCSQLKGITLPDTLLEIEHRAFDGCKGITELIIPDSVITINEGAFAGMCNLEKVTAPFVGKSRDVQTDTGESLIGHWFSGSRESHDCIYNCEGGFTEIKQIYNDSNYQRYSYKPRYFTELTITDSLLRSNSLNNYGIKVLTLDENVKGIEKYAANKVGLEELYIDENIKATEIPDYAFCNNNLTSITIPGNIKKIGKAFICDYYPDNKITEINLNEGLEIINGSFAGSKISSIEFPKSLKKILKYSFRNCTKLEYVEFPGDLIEIGDWAFDYCCNLKEVVFSDSIEKIGSCAFMDCPIKKVVIPEKMKDVLESTFGDCEELEVVVVGGSVKEIGTKAFENCTSLEAIIIPDSVSYISDDAFKKANENLVIYCNEGSYAQSYAAKNNIKYTTLVIDPIENQKYTGKEIKPDVNASANNRRLTQGTEYTVTYKDNINIGTAKVIAKGLGDFKHLAATAKFTILPRGVEDVRVLSSGATYSPKGVEPELYVLSGSQLLVEGQDYEILDKSVLTDAGEYNLTVALMGNFDGVINVIYKISRRSVTSTDIEYGSTVKVTFDGVTLKEGKDYIVTKETNENGDVVTTVEGIGNYKGTASHTENKDNEESLSWFERFINAIKELFEKLFNIV